MEATPAKNQRLGPILYYIPSQNALFCLPITARRNGGHAHAHACASLDLLRVLLVESWINLWKMMTTVEMKKKSCSCLTVLPGPAWVLLSKKYIYFFRVPCRWLIALPRHTSLFSTIAFLHVHKRVLFSGIAFIHHFHHLCVPPAIPLQPFWSQRWLAVGEWNSQLHTAPPAEAEWKNQEKLSISW